MSLEELINKGNKTGIISLLAQRDWLWGGGKSPFRVVMLPYQ